MTEHTTMSKVSRLRWSRSGRGAVGRRRRSGALWLLLGRRAPSTSHAWCYRTILRSWSWDISSASEPWFPLLRWRFPPCTGAQARFGAAYLGFCSGFGCWSAG